MNKHTKAKKCRSIGRSLERRAAVVSRINRSSTARQPVVNRTFCSPIGLNGNSFVRASEGLFKTFVFDALEALGGKEDSWLFPGQTVPFASCPAAPRPANPPCTAPPRLARGMSGFGIRQLLHSNSDRMT